MSSRKTAGAFVAVAALAGSLYAAAFSSAAGTRVASQVVRTFNCKIDPVDVEKGVQIAVSDSGVQIATGDPSSPEKFVMFNTMGSGYLVGGRCHSVTRKVVMSRNDLSASHAALVDCAAPAHVLIRVLLRFDSGGHPTSAKIEVTQPHAKFKPLGQVVWSPAHATTYYRHGSCTTS
jgi:hypothetical protein